MHYALHWGPRAQGRGGTAEAKGDKVKQRAELSQEQTGEEPSLCSNPITSPGTSTTVLRGHQFAMLITQWISISPLYIHIHSFPCSLLLYVPPFITKNQFLHLSFGSHHSCRNLSIILSLVNSTPSPPLQPSHNHLNMIKFLPYLKYIYIPPSTSFSVQLSKLTSWEWSIFTTTLHYLPFTP